MQIKQNLHLILHCNDIHTTYYLILTLYIPYVFVFLYHVYEIICKMTNDIRFLRYGKKSYQLKNINNITFDIIFDIKL